MKVRTLFPLLFPLLVLGCPKAEEKTTKDEKADKKKNAEEGDDDDKKPKKKKGGDESEGEKKNADEDDAGGAVAPANSADNGRGGDKASVIDPTTPIPPGCAPADNGRLGAKPKYLTSAGQPGASLAVWAAASDTAMKGPFAMTISADGKCYVHYEKARMEQERPNASLRDVKFEKGAIQAVNGIDDKGNTFVGFRVAYLASWQTATSTVAQQQALYFGYVSAGSVPYSCNAIPGEAKSNACAMYHTPLHVFEKETCTLAAGIPPTLASVPPTLSSAAPPVLVAPGVPKLKLGGNPLASAKPSASASTPAPLASSSAKPGESCGPESGCEAKSVLVKEPKHTFVRVLAGALPNKCPSSRQPIAPHVGDTWYFESNHWVKR